MVLPIKKANRNNVVDNWCVYIGSFNSNRIRRHTFLIHYYPHYCCKISYYFDKPQ